MIDNMNRSQQLIIKLLSDGKKYTYEDIASITGLSYDGVRGRISELVSLEVPIQRTRAGKNTICFLEKSFGGKKKVVRQLSRPRKHSDVVSERLRSVEDFMGVGEFLFELRGSIPAVKRDTYAESDRTAVLLLSDLHFGEIIKNEHGKVIYNTRIACDRLFNTFNNASAVMENQDVDTLRIMLLGDLVDGDSIYRNHLFRIEKAAIDQVKDVVRELTKNINMLVKEGVKIRVDAVRGNHGITNYNNLEEDNWDNVVYDMLDLIFEDNKMVTFNHYQSDQAKVPVLDRSFVLYHGQNMGNQIKTSSGLKTFRGMCGRHRLKDNDIIVVGHLHEFGIESDQGKYLVRNGALPDASEYAVKLNLLSEPEQTMLIIEEGQAYPIIIPLEVR